MTPPAPPKNEGKSNLTTAIAIIVLLAFAALIAYMMFQLKSDETYWTRALYLFGGVEAIAFAAAGYLFGREVSREQINKAENQAENDRRDAQQAQQNASTAVTKAKDIVAAVKSSASGGTTPVETYSALGASQQQAQAIEAALKQLAQTVEEIHKA